MSFLENYEDVATRIQRFWATHPSGKIHTSITDIDLAAGYVLVECRVYKEYEDHEPSAIDFAYGNVATFNAGMKKWFVEDTVTSAIGRAVGLVLGTDKRPTAQNMAQVEQAQPQAKAVGQVVWDAQEREDPWATNPEAAPLDAYHCIHGDRVVVEGEKNGKAYYGMGCPKTRNSGEQCAANWFVMSAEGRWVPK
jgi:hypothetical protein